MPISQSPTVTPAQTPTTLTNPTSQLGGLYATLSPFGALNVTTDSVPLFGDTFEGGALDTTVRWATSGTVVPTLSTGNLLVNPSITGSATSALSSQPSFKGLGTATWAMVIAIEAAVTLGNHRFWGAGVPPSTPGTAAAPLQDAIGFEVDTAGALRASVYAGGTRVSSTVLTRPTDGLTHSYAVITRGDISMFYMDNFDLVVAFSATRPNVQTLPFRYASLNSASVTVGTPTMTSTGAALFDSSHSFAAIADATYPHRQAKVDTTGALSIRQPPVTTGTITSVTAAAADTLVLASNANRLAATFYNESTAVLYLALSTSTASVTAYTVQVPPGGYYELPGSPVSYSGQVRGIWAAANGAVRVTEMT